MKVRVRAILLMLIAGCSSPAPSSDAGADAGAPDGGLDGGEMARAHVPAPFAPTPETIAYCRGDDVAIEARITELLARMTLSQKLAMMSGAPFAEGVWPVGGDDALGIPGLHMLDGPRGLSAFSGKRGTAFPVAMLRGATWDPELERRVGRAMAREIRSAGADVLLAPTINLLRHPRWGRAQETYGEDVCHMGQMGVAFIDGVQSENVIASVKHYAANSIEDTRHTVDVELDERTLREIYLPHFRRAVVDARAGSVMSAYNSVNGSFCDLNRHLLTDILRDEWGFAGFVESDWFAGTHGDAESVLAGLDIEMPFTSRFRALPRAIREGRLTEHDIDRSVRRILRAQFCFGLDARERVLDDPSARETPEHLALALEVAQRGIVLLRNEGGALPLDRSAIVEVAVLGRNAGAESIGDMGSSSVRPTDVVTALEGLRDRAASGPSAVTITHVPDDGGALDAAGRAAVARAGAVVIVTGLRSEDEGEGEIAG
ncbi:MAG: glycoside hydrolase family 3 C-terminal domain-containing protein, partial [Sandaracinaceae bacterium]|nr:glycoside hydrolase family 3 C-terminal domain-containing protein [Sandaracinaceae bacterium]